MNNVQNHLETIRHVEVRNRLNFAATAKADELLRKLVTTPEGLSEALVPDLRETYGNNKVTHGKKASLPQRLAKAFINPFTSILIALALVSVFTDIIMAEPGEADPAAVIIITTMVLISGVLRFVQETRSGNAAENLLKMITTTTNVQRLETGKQEIPLEDVIVSDIVHLAAGDMIPADMRIIQAKDLFISQSSLTGESEPVEKTPQAVPGVSDRSLAEMTKPLDKRSLTEMPNLALMGSNVISGSAAA